MDRDIPIFNRPVMEKIFKKNQEMHRKRLKNIMNAHNNYTSNKSYTLSREKAYVIQETKQLEIERNNNILFNRMANIMNRHDPINKSFNRSYHSVIKPRMSEEMNRINEQNKSLHSRLQSQKATISNKKFAQQRKKNLTFLKFLGKYPNPQANKCKTSKRNSEYRQGNQDGTFYQSNYMNQQLDFLSTYKNISTQYQKKSSSSSNRIFKTQGIQRKLKNQTQEGQQLHRSNSKTMPQNHEIVLYETNCKISGKLVFLRIKRLDSSYQVVATLTSKGKQPISYKISFQQQVGNQFFMNMDYDYKKIVQMLYIENQTLMFQNKMAKTYKKNDKNTFFPQIAKKVSPTNFSNKYEEALEEIVQE